MNRDKAGGVTVKNAGISIQIYPLHRKQGSAWLLSYYLDSIRQRVTFRGSLDGARKYARKIAKQVSGQTAGHCVLSPAEAETYRSALAHLESVDVPLTAAVEEYVAARKLIGNHSLLEAARFYKRNYPFDMPAKSVRAVMEEMIEAKRADNLSERYVTALRYDLTKLADAIEESIAEITTAQLDDWLRSLPVSSRTRSNARTSVVTLFQFAKSRGYLPRDRDTAASLTAIGKVTEGEIEIFTPKEMAALLAATDVDTIPVLVLGGFCGLRSAEILRLDWQDIDFEQQHIKLSAAKTKTAQRRIVPLLPNAADWLSPYRNEVGHVMPCLQQRMNDVLRACAHRARIKWKRNALRHSFASYRLADCKSAPQVALEMGNSPQIVFQHYREIVTSRDAALWWAIMPNTPANVLPMKAALAH